VDLVCHHKSEFVYWTKFFQGRDNVRIIFSSWFQDLWQQYSANADVVVSTRLHAVLLARAMGIPGIIINGTDRHEHALREIPDTNITLQPGVALDYIRKVSNDDAVNAWRKKVREHQAHIWNRYTEEIEPHVKKLLV
jgi:polysaccharide pyruvyl transferase WcaK-like protein